MVRLDHVHLPVRDLRASTAFYRDTLGFELGYEDERMVELSEVGIVLDQAEGGQSIGGGVIVGVQVDDVDAVCAALTLRGLELDPPPEDRPWGVRNFYVTDPDGHQIEFEQPLAPTLR